MAKGQSALHQGKTPLGTIMLLAWPIILEQLLMTMVQYVDTAMVGTLGAGATAAVAINQSPIMLVNGLFMALGVGFTVLVARAVGAQDIGQAAHLSGQAMLTTAVVGGVFTAVMVGLSPFIPGWMGAEEAILADANGYCLVIAASLFFKAGMMIFNAILRGAGDTKTPMQVNSAMNLLNVVGNFLLIYPARTVQLLGREIPVWGAGMGVVGAGLATSLSTVAGMGMLLWVVAGNRSGVPLAPERSLRPDWPLLRQVLGISIPAAGERLVMSVGQILVTMIVSSLGTVALAAHHLSIVAESLCYMPAMGFSTAGTTLTGQALGARREDLADILSRESIRISFWFMAGMGTLLFVCAPVLARFFTQDGQVLSMAVLCLRIVAFSEPFVGLSMTITGVLRGAGDTKWPFIVALISMWGVRIVLAYVLCILLQLGLPAMWFCMVVDFATRSAILYWRYRTGHWKRVLA